MKKTIISFLLITSLIGSNIKSVNASPAVLAPIGLCAGTAGVGCVLIGTALVAGVVVYVWQLRDGTTVIADIEGRVIPKASKTGGRRQRGNRERKKPARSNNSTPSPVTESSGGGSCNRDENLNETVLSFVTRCCETSVWWQAIVPELKEYSLKQIMTFSRNKNHNLFQKSITAWKVLGKPICRGDDYGI